MSRPLRLEYPDAFYHVISRGHRRENIFNSDLDREQFLRRLKESILKYGIKLHAYVLMNNHYHLLLETPKGNLSTGMHYLNTSYSCRIEHFYINGSKITDILREIRYMVTMVF